MRCWPRVLAARHRVDLTFQSTETYRQRSSAGGKGADVSVGTGVGVATAGEGEGEGDGTSPVDACSNWEYSVTGSGIAAPPPAWLPSMCSTSSLCKRIVSLWIWRSA